MKKVLLAIALITLVGCDSSARQYNPEVIPPGLADCKFFKMNDKGNFMRIVRCPNSSTSAAYKNGKSDAFSATVEE